MLLDLASIPKMIYTRCTMIENFLGAPATQYVSSPCMHRHLDILRRAALVQHHLPPRPPASVHITTVCVPCLRAENALFVLYSYSSSRLGGVATQSRQSDDAHAGAPSSSYPSSPPAYPQGSGKTAGVSARKSSVMRCSNVAAEATRGVRGTPSSRFHSCQRTTSARRHTR